MKNRARLPHKIAAWAAGALALAVQTAHPAEIKLATILPAGTSGDQCIREMGDRWQKSSGQSVRLKVWAGGSQGGEAAVVRKMRGGQLDAAVLSVVGLSEIDRSVTALQIMPMMFRTWDEVDHVRETIRPDLEQRLLAKGFVTLFWADAGWVRYFSKKPATHPNDFKPMSLFVWAGDPAQLQMMKDLEYKPVGLETSDIGLGLMNNQIQVVPMPPFMALASQVNKYAPHMLDVKWVPIVGAAVIRRETWETIPAELKKQFLQAAQDAGEKMRLKTRSEDDAAITSMAKRGLTVHAATPEVEAAWRAIAEKAYPQIRGSRVPADLFDRVQTTLREFRTTHKPTPQ